ncbi:hypothetical protein FRB99_004026, partial [Tulasnella sp. 403]
MLSSIPSDLVRVRTNIESGLHTLREGLSETDTLSPPTLESFDNVTAQLQDFRRCVDLEIARQNRLRNALLPIHQLPGELFLMILQTCHDFYGYEGWTTDANNLHRLVQVSTFWRDTIFSSPWFWRVLRDTDREEVMEAMLERNPTADLVLRVESGSSYSRRRFIKTMVDHSHRWRAIYFVNSYPGEELLALQNATYANLQDLSLILSRGSNMKKFILSAGQPLRYLELSRVSIPWECPRLHGLKSIRLEYLDADLPSLPQLVAILSSCPELQRIVFRGWEGVPQGLEQDQKNLSDTCIKLPLLSTLVLRFLHPEITTFLLTHVETSTPCCFVVNKVLPTAFTCPRSAFIKLLAPTLRKTLSLAVTHETEKGSLRIESRPAPRRMRESVYWADEFPGFFVELPMKDISAKPEDWVSVFKALDSLKVPIRLELDRKPPVGPEAHLEGPDIFPTECLQILSQLEELTLLRSFGWGPVLRYLGTPEGSEEGTP